MLYVEVWWEINLGGLFLLTYNLGVLHNYPGWIVEQFCLEFKLHSLGVQRYFYWIRSKISINLISQGCPNTHLSYTLVGIIQDCTLRCGIFNWCHIFREANQPANDLAKFGFSIEGVAIIFDWVPYFVYRYVMVVVFGIVSLVDLNKFLFLGVC